MFLEIGSFYVLDIFSLFIFSSLNFFKEEIRDIECEIKKSIVGILVEIYIIRNYFIGEYFYFFSKNRLCFFEINLFWLYFVVISS